VYTIKKRTGEGFRTIAHPTPELKLLQRWLSVRVFSQLLVHDCVYSYKRGVSIREHAEKHRAQNFLLRIDLRDFFPSISYADLIRLFRSNEGRFTPRLAIEDYRLAAKIACKGTALTIGAPSSPVLSNAILFRFDEMWSKRSGEVEVVYTRYADDLYFSTDKPGVLEKVHKDVRQSLVELEWPRLKVNEAKTTFTSRKRRRVVTGLTLTSSRSISLGRSSKRYLRSLVHKFLVGKATEDESSYLKGYISYAKNVEPRFIDALKTKYGEAAIATILSIVPVSRKG
jgi:hypothetical protein